MPATCQRYTTCDHCGEVRNRCHLETWTCSEGEDHAVCHSEVDEYLAALREARETRRTSDGTRIV